MNRRHFLAASAVTGAGLAVGGRLKICGAAVPAAPAGEAPAPQVPRFKTKLHKALLGVPGKEVFRRWRAAGFEGMESTAWQVSPKEAAAARKLAESLDMRIHSVLFGWGKMNGGPSAVSRGVAVMQSALQAAQAYGAETVLYVPCKIGGMAIPESWEFDIRFDEKTDHLRQVVAGDNAKYEKYIAAHNHAADASREGVKLLIPAAERAGVVIALENVWNNLWVKPDFFAHFVASFQSPWVRAYFDIGNHVKYAPPQQWIRTLGKLLVKCHVKDFKLDAHGGGGYSGFRNIREGSVDWPAVRKALDEISYNGWMSIEGGNLRLDEASKRLDLIIAGR